MSTVEIENIGPIERLTLPVPEDGGIVVLHGRNGSGKTKSLEAVEKLASGRGGLQVRDGALKGGVSGFGATLTVARSTTRRGTLDVESLDGKLSLADLVRPPVKEAAAADARRIKTLVSLAGQEPDPVLFHAIAGGAESFAEILPLAEAPDLVALAARVKREFEAAARKEENAGKKAEIVAQAHHEAICTIDLSESVDSDAAYAALQEATKRHTELVERQQAADDAGDRAIEARGKLEAAEQAYSGPTPDDAVAKWEKAKLSAKRADDTVMELEEKLHVANVARNTAEGVESTCKTTLITARRHAAAMTAWRETLDAESPLAPAPGDISAAATRLEKARHDVAKLPAYEQAKQHQAAALEADQEADLHQEFAERLRDVAKGTDGVLSEVVGKLGTPLRVEAGRLVLDTERGDTYFHELSHGEQWRLGLDIAVAVAGARTLFTIPQEAWESLDPQNREEISKHVKQKGIIVLTAESTADDKVTAEVFEEVDHDGIW